MTPYTPIDLQHSKLNEVEANSLGILLTRKLTFPRINLSSEVQGN